ncbi:unnamed protein product [Ambrosiozyma monospora]|uniref:Unnamed protein product n=1 Tax=Ambrosiozyma monospora TaxID=43982 RepID=A0ACB5SX76_AMBMO|nr:unnamed protein product [Ambrosiozyma monospora]
MICEICLKKDDLNNKFHSADYYEITSALEGITTETPFDLTIGPKLARYQNLRSDDTRELKLKDISDTALAIINRFCKVIEGMKNYLKNYVRNKKKKDPELNETTKFKRYMVHLLISLPILQYLSIPGERNDDKSDDENDYESDDENDNESDETETNEEETKEDDANVKELDNDETDSESTTCTNAGSSGSVNQVLEAAKLSWLICDGPVLVQIESSLETKFEEFLKLKASSPHDNIESPHYPSLTLVTQYAKEDTCANHLEDALMWIVILHQWYT